MEITATKIEQWAPNADAVKNGRDLVSKNKFSNLKIDDARTLIWGECAGSGKTPYACSADFSEAASPVFRCNCPSRQFPCKHAIGLLYAYEKGLSFATDIIPQDILDKRNKIEKKQEKKVQEKESLKEKAAKPPKINKAAVIKKLDTQLSGISLAGKLLTSIVQNGLSSIDAKENRNLQAQIKELGNYYIPGIQTALNDLLIELGEVQNEEYTFVIDQLNFIAALLKKSTTYLNARKEDPEAAPEINSTIEEQIGTVWKLTDLVQLGLYEEQAALVQLSFNSYDNPARKEFVDEGAWLNLKTGRIYKTKNYRPYKAVKYIREDNSIQDVILLKEMYIYPGDLNARIRWEPETRTDRTLTEEDLSRIRSFAAADLGETLKTVKNSIKNPLADKNPLVLVKINKAYRNGQQLVLQDPSGNTLTMKDIQGQLIESGSLLQLILPAEPKDMCLLVMIHNNVQTGLLSAVPLSLITAKKIVKLFY